MAEASAALQLLTLYIADAIAFYSDTICHSSGHAVAPLLAQHLKSVVLLPAAVAVQGVRSGQQDLAGEQGRQERTGDRQRPDGQFEARIALQLFHGQPPFSIL